MARLDRAFEQVFMDVALAEGREFTSPREDLAAVAQNLECSFVDVTFAEAGEFTSTACLPRIPPPGTVTNPTHF